MRIRGWLAIRPGEGRLAALLASMFALIEAGRGLGEIAADTLFLRRVGADSLPYLYVGLGLFSLVLVVGFGAGLGALRRRPFLVTLLVGFATLLLGERLAMASGSAILLPIVWISVFAIGAVLGTFVWAVAGTTLDVRQAKRLFPLCMSAAIAGGFVGTLVAGPVSRVVGIENLLVLDAVMLLAAALVTARLVRPAERRAGPGPVPGSGGRSLIGHLRSGYDEVRRSPLMRLVAVAYVLFSVLHFSVNFPFMTVMEEAFPTDGDLATALGLVSAAVTGLSFVISVTIANRFYRRFGIAAAALLLPVVYLAGFGLWIVGFSLATAIAVRVAQQVTQRGISNAAWSALYNVMPAERRPQVLAFMDGVPGQIGISLSGVALAAIAGLLGPQPIYVMGFLVAAACTWIVALVRRRYGAALVRTLRAGLAEQVLEGGPGLAALGRGMGVTEDLRTALGASQPGARRLAVELLGGLADPDAFKDVAAALDDEDPGVRAAAVRALATIDPVAAADRAADVATDPDPAVRAAAALALATCGNPGRARDVVATLFASGDPIERAAGIRAAGRLATGDDAAPGPDLIEAAIGDPSPAVRAAAADALGTLGARDGLVLDGAGTRLAAALDDDDVAVRQAAARALGVRPEWSPLAVEVLRSGSDRAQSGALLALAAGGGADADVARGPVRDWALAQVERATTLRRHAAALADGSRTEPERPVQEPADDPARAGDAGAFLRFLVEGRGRDVEDRILAAIATLGAPEANGPIRRSLRSTDPETRAQAIEALEAIGDAGLGRALARLLVVDREMPEAPGDVLRDLEADPDPWIRLLALRAGAERLSGEWQALAARASADPDPNVRAAIAAIPKPGGATMPETDRTLGEIDRMLFLRRVPLFSELAPEDLQRIATTATERLYPAGEALVREGEIGDELIVIVEGGVRVVRAEPNGERLLRRYEAGDHIGELAVLRDRPRVATVIAEADVRGLVIGGDGLRAILRERPDAAMAMLATLAERISVQ